MDKREHDRVSRLPETVMFAVSVLVVLAISVLSYRSARQAEEVDRQLDTSRRLVNLTDDLLSSLKDAETGQRGFLLIGRAQYLEPYDHAVARIPAILAGFRETTREHPDQRVRFIDLEAHVESKLAELKRTVDLRRAGKTREALAVVDAGEGRSSMDQIRAGCADIRRVAEARLATISQEARRSAKNFRAVATTGGALLLVFIGLTAVASFHGMERRDELYAQAYAGQKLLTTTLSSIGDAVIATNAAAAITFINPVAEQLTGWSRHEAIGVHVSQVFSIVNETSGAKVANPLEKALAQGISFGLANHTVLISRSGKRYAIDDSAAPIRNDKAEIVGAVIVFRDITIKREQQRELAESAAALKRSNEDLQNFASVAAHDLRSPLNSANAMAQLLERRFDGKLGPEGSEIIGCITDAMSRMARLVDDLLSFAKAGDRSESNTGPVSMNDIVDRARTNLGAEIADSGAIISVDPLETVIARETEMLQLIQNILGNALKYRGVDPPEIHISCERRDAECVFSVKDNGVGIASQYTEEVFKPFKRLHGPEVDGSGIGLATCRKIVDAYGGRIWVESQLGEGSTFFFTLPMRERRADASGKLDETVA